MNVETALATLRADAPARLDADAVEALAGMLQPAQPSATWWRMRSRSSAKRTLS